MTPILAVISAVLLGPATDPVTSVDILPAAEHTEIVIAVEGELEFRDFTLEGPARLVVDLMGTEHALPRSSYDIARGGVRALRSSQFSRDVTRVVFELDRIFPYRVETGDGFLRVVLQAPGDLFEPWSTGPAPSASQTSEPSTAADPFDELVTADRAGATSTAATPPVLIPAPQQVARRITVSFTATPIQDVLFTFAEFAGQSIVSGADVSAMVSADIRDQPWDIALQTILEAHGLAAREMETGIIRVDNIQNLSQRETIEPVRTRPYRVNYATAEEIQTSVQGMLSERGTVSVGEGTNTVIVTDIERVLDAVEQLVGDLDIRTPMVNISAKIVFVNRTDLQEFGVTYDLKDSNGNQLNFLTPGAVDADGDGVLELPDEQVNRGTDVVSLGGNSIAALGNARNRVANPTLSMLSSLLIGRYTLLNFIEALESANMSDIQATPTLTVMDNQEANLLVGERTPLRVIDLASQGAGGGGGGGAGGGQQTGVIPQATVRLEETGIKLIATPHVTAGNTIMLDLHAERSAAELAESDVGFIFQTQEATSRFLVEDGETIVIAGLTVTERSEVRSGIPLLMNLPVIGRLFRVSRDQEIQRDLIILVTPQIVQPS